MNGQRAAEQAIVLNQHEMRSISDESFLQQQHLPSMLSQYFIARLFSWLHRLLIDLRVLLLVQPEEVLDCDQDVHELLLLHKQQEVLILGLLVWLPSFDADSTVEYFDQTSDGLFVVLQILNNTVVTFSSSENVICPNLSLALIHLLSSNSQESFSNS